MQKVIYQLKDFLKNDFNIYSYSWALIFLITSITINYTLNFEHKYINPTQSSGMSMFWFTLFYLFAWFIIAIPKLLIDKNYKTLTNPLFYVKILIFLSIIGIASGFGFQKKWNFGIEDKLTHFYIIKSITQLKCLAIYTIPFIAMKYFFDKSQSGIYGFSRKFGNGKIYLQMLLLVAPVIIIVSFTADFIHAYPRFQPWRFAEMQLMPLWASTSIFESLYIVDYVMVEWAFRGALVIGMISVMGKDAILPMVSVYVFLHFGKPLGESIGAMFGGYILGVLAYTTRHIWGGVILHAGIALIMEFMGFFQFYIMGMRR